MDAVFLKRYHERIQRLEEDSLASLMPLMQLQDVKSVYKKCNGIAQSLRSRRGREFELIMEDILKEHDIPYLAQVSDVDGIICGKKRGHVHDFIIDAKLGDPLKDKVVLSCKTSLRERYLQDANIECKKLFMITLEDTRKNAKYNNNNIHIVTIGKENSLEDLINSLKTPTQD